jgi:P-type Cu2+ transporter
MPSQALVSTAVLDDPLEQGGFTRYDTAADGTQSAQSWLQIGGMHCAACAGLIEAALLGVAGVSEAEVSSVAERARVAWDPARTKVSALVEAVQRAGYDAAPDNAHALREGRVAEQRRALWRLFVAAFCAMQVMMMATPIYVAAPGEMAEDLRQLLNWGGWLLTLPVLFFSAAPFFGGAWRSLKLRRIGMDVPVALGLAVAFVASTAATFDPGGVFGREVYFDSLTMFVSLLLGARWLELRARHRAAATLEAALSRLPETALRLRDDGSEEAVSPQRLVPGDRVRVPLGQAFSADGIVIEGRTQADEALLSGESRPLAKKVGDSVVAGSLNIGAPVLMRVERVGADTRHAAIVELMRAAATQRPALARTADRFAGPFMWAVLLLAAAAGAAWSVIDPPRAIGVAVAVLIVTCPCALSLAAPSALLAATGALARRGVLLQRPDALEALARIDRLFIDKTGTLTEDRPVLQRVHLLPAGLRAGLDESAALRRAASLARWSHHPLSRALFDATPDAQAQWTELSESPGQGLEALDEEGRRLRLGSATWLDTTGLAPDGVFFGPPSGAWACFEFDEALRPDAAPALKALRDAGVEVALLSGDQPQRVAAMARRLGIEEARGGASPEDKLVAVTEAQARGHVVAMVGDGLNDAPVLARADVSFAMRDGALASRVQADAVLLSTRLSDLAFARSLARRTLRVIRQNLAWSALYNAACIPLALIGWLPPWAAGIGMATSSLFVVLNALRLSRA